MRSILAQPFPLPLRIVFVHPHVNVGKVIFFEIASQFLDGLGRDVMIVRFPIEGQDASWQSDYPAHAIEGLVWLSIGNDDRLPGDAIWFLGMKMSVPVRHRGAAGRA